MFNIRNKKIWVAGHTGMVGRAVCAELAKEEVTPIVVSSQELDLRRQSDVEAWIKSEQPDAIIMCAARVGGILANDTNPAEFLYENLIMETNVIHAAHMQEVAKLVFLGSSCIYPKYAQQPIKEEYLLTGALEPTNEWYALAKIAGIKLCESYRRQYSCDFISLMPTNLYGPHDNFDLQTSHVLPALLRKCHEAKIENQCEMEIWGTGNIRREFLHVDDCAKGIVFMLKNYSGPEHVNLGTGSDIKISDLAILIKDIVGFKGQFNFDRSKPDGTPRKLLDTSLINDLGWRPSISLKDGIEQTYEWYLEKANLAR